MRPSFLLSDAPGLLIPPWAAFWCHNWAVGLSLLIMASGEPEEGSKDPWLELAVWIMKTHHLILFPHHLFKLTSSCVCFLWMLHRGVANPVA